MRAKENDIDCLSVSLNRHAWGCCFKPGLVSCEQLSERLGNVKVVDASWYLPQMKRNSAAEFQAKRIKSAVFFDIDETSDKLTTLPHMLPPVANFAKEVSRLGLHPSDTIVAYDGAGIFSSPRVYWMFHVSSL